jgi:hypothetical protein
MPLNIPDGNDESICNMLEPGMIQMPKQLPIQSRMANSICFWDCGKSRLILLLESGHSGPPIFL